MADTTIEGSARAQAVVMQTIRIVRKFVDQLDLLSVDEFTAAADQLARTEFAWIVDQVDNARVRVSDLVAALADTAKRHGADAANWDEISLDLEQAGDGIYKALGAIDPDVERFNIVGRLGDDEE